MEKRVLVDGLGAIGLAVTAHVRSDGVEACFGECAELMSPGIPRFGKAVTQKDERAAAALGDVHADAVGVDGAMGDVRHGQPLRLLRGERMRARCKHFAV